MSMTWSSQIISVILAGNVVKVSQRASLTVALASTEWRNQSVCMWSCQECSQGGRGVLCWIYLPNGNPVHAWSWKEPHTRTNWGANSDIPQEWHGFTDCWGKNMCRTIMATSPSKHCNLLEYFECWAHGFLAVLSLLSSSTLDPEVLSRNI